MPISHRFKSIFHTDIPLILAPMASAADSAMAIEVAQAGGLGSIACALLNEQQIRSEVQKFRQACPGKALNLNFFCHTNEEMTDSQENLWLQTLAPYYKELALEPTTTATFSIRKSFDESLCWLLEGLKPEVVSFHFGLPQPPLIERLKKSGCKILSSATTVQEALWLEAHGCDAIIAQGLEAGGHRGMFLSHDVTTQIGTIALVPLIVDRVKVPVIAAGGIGDGRGVAAAFALGASAVQIGSAYLLTKESKISSAHRSALLSKQNEETVITNLFSGKPARSVKNRLIQDLGALSEKAPPFPYAGKALAPLKAVTEDKGSTDFMSLWSGQAIGLRKEILSAKELTQRIFKEAQEIWKT